MKIYDIIVIGAGPAGISAAIAAKKEGIDDLIIIDREDNLGGILNQCIHDGFGMDTFNENITGPEYAERLIEIVKTLNIVYKTNTTVLNIDRDKIVTAVNGTDGVFKIRGKALIYAAGARENGNLKGDINRNKCAGIYTAGAVQRFVNMEGYATGKNVIVLGSNNIGLIMAGRLEVEGIHVEAIIERKNHILGLKKNFENWVKPFNIPVRLGYDVIQIQGTQRITGVNVIKVDINNRKMEGTEEFIACDNLILAFKLIPEIEIISKLGVSIGKETQGPKVDETLQTDIGGIFVCGNALHINESADSVAKEGNLAGINAANYVK